MTARKLSGPPNLLGLYAKAALPLVPGVSRLPFLAGGGKDVPDLELTLEDVRADPGQLASYSEVCGFATADTLPVTYPHILAFPLHMALMTDGAFPFPAVGLVHIENRITQHRPIGSEETLSLRVRATKLEPHPKGRKFAVLTEARAGGELVWEGASTNLRRGGGAGPAEPREPARELPRMAEWRLPGDLGRRYAGVSGDRNPIHLHPATARLLGFPRAIAHGMWTKARALAALELPGSVSVDVHFRRPILLPATVEFATQDERFAVRGSDGTPHLDGLLRPL
jgi:acyl dehydratase